MWCGPVGPWIYDVQSLNWIPWQPFTAWQRVLQLWGPQPTEPTSVFFMSDGAQCVRQKDHVLTDCMNPHLLLRRFNGGLSAGQIYELQCRGNEEQKRLEMHVWAGALLTQRTFIQRKFQTLSIYLLIHLFLYFTIKGQIRFWLYKMFCLFGGYFVISWAVWGALL